jgi:hypothetical protein
MCIRSQPAGRAAEEAAMKKSVFGDWQPMESAPRDGRRVLVALRASEPGSAEAEVDIARWASPGPSEEPAWIASDSDPDCVILYADADLDSWMPMLAPLPPLRARRRRGSRAAGIFQSDGSSA